MNADQLWFEAFFSEESDIRVYADDNFLVIAAYSNDKSSDLLIKEDLVYESNESN